MWGLHIYIYRNGLGGFGSKILGLRVAGVGRMHENEVHAGLAASKTPSRSRRKRHRLPGATSLFLLMAGDMVRLHR